MVEANQPRFWLAVAFTPLGWVAKQRGAKPLYTWLSIIFHRKCKVWYFFYFLW
ncbi:hypothetical protein [Spiroplasma endosymbiont of Andrena trimmerana]|uniref:hypothetical protein n=1 Tax=Spiroplasma endosymbiont of Andrena trimmerana TaxID=3066316 RepID=UPI0030D10857